MSSLQAGITSRLAQGALEIVDFAEASWLRGEKGMDTAWMPYVGPVKTALPVGVALLIMQGVSETLKCVYAIQKGRWPS